MCKINEKEAIEGTSIDMPKFDLRDYNFVNGYKSQSDGSRSAGVCWTFGVLNSLESHLLFAGKGEYDLSEAHLVFTTQNTYSELEALPYNRKMTAGGGNNFGAEYFVNRVGPVLEDNVKYSVLLDAFTGVSVPTIDDISNSNGNLYKPIFSVNDVSRFSQPIGACTNTSKEQIKRYIITNGALSATYRQSLASFNDVDDEYYYYSNSSNTTTNHLVDIIGWDDTVSVNNFKEGNRPLKNGAWIVKNTSAHSPKQYHYISYEDILICIYVVGFHNVDFDVEDYSYIHDKLGAYSYIAKKKNLDDTSSLIEYDSEYFYVANKFKKESTNNETLKKITINTRLINQKYDILYSSNGDLSDMELIYSGYSDKNGYTTIDVSNLNIIIESDNFALAVKYYNKDGNNQIPVYRKSSDVYLLDVEVGKSFMSQDGITWTNLQNAKQENCYASIKAYTDGPDVKVLEAKFAITEGVESISDTALSCKIGEDKCKIVLPNIKARKGYSVLGWYTEKSGGTKVGIPGDNYELTKDVTLYARVLNAQEVLVPSTGVKIYYIFYILISIIGAIILISVLKKAKDKKAE